MDKQIIAVVGDYWHDRNTIEEALQAAKHSLNVTITVVETEQELMEHLPHHPAAVIVFRCKTLNGPDEEPNVWLSDATEQAIVEYVNEGGRLLAWHSGMAFYEKESAYIELLRGRFLHHPPMKYVDYIDAVTGEPIMTLYDEHYFVEVDEHRTDVFLYAVSDQERQIAGWTHTYGEGRVCCLVPAHESTALLNEQFQGLLCERLKILIES